MLNEMSSMELTEWQVYFQIKEKREKKHQAEEEAKMKAKSRARGH